MRLIALCDAWIVIIQIDKEVVFDVHAGEWHEDWNSPPIMHPIIPILAGDRISFKNIAPGNNPYQTLAKSYPEFFRLEKEEDDE